jgi:hypothetical protein
MSINFSILKLNVDALYFNYSVELTDPLMFLVTLLKDSNIIIFVMDQVLDIN